MPRLPIGKNSFCVERRACLYPQCMNGTSVAARHPKENQRWGRGQFRLPDTGLQRLPGSTETAGPARELPWPSVVDPDCMVIFARAASAGTSAILA